MRSTWPGCSNASTRMTSSPSRPTKAWTSNVTGSGPATPPGITMSARAGKSPPLAQYGAVSVRRLPAPRRRARRRAPEPARPRAGCPRRATGGPSWPGRIALAQREGVDIAAGQLGGELGCPRRPAARPGPRSPAARSASPSRVRRPGPHGRALAGRCRAAGPAGRRAGTPSRGTTSRTRSPAGRRGRPGSRPARSGPGCSTAIRSATSSASSWSWVTRTVVTCTSSWSRRSQARRSARTLASSAPNGSSSSSTLRVDGERAGEGHPLALAAGQLGGVAVLETSSPTTSSSSSTLRWISALGRLRMDRPKATLSRTVMCLNAA